ncbi:unnamed protein product [Cuscuta europaea]|uniref:Uncharacterized protein n=1 Tax=Cuscuta europaea TaxID=41803 RepID=A0A9P1EJT3_CUSEU|nr:unnamed protein product [Cuscuta europaea]
MLDRDTCQASDGRGSPQSGWHRHLHVAALNAVVGCDVVLGTVIQAHVERRSCRGRHLRLKGVGPKALLIGDLSMPRASSAEGLVFKPCSHVMFLSPFPSRVAFGHGDEGTPLCIVGCLELHLAGLGPFGPVGPDCGSGSMWVGGPWAIYSIRSLSLFYRKVLEGK